MQSWMKRLHSTEDGRMLLQQEDILIQVTEGISRLMNVQGVSKSELAERLNVSPAFITKLLRGSNNFTLRKMSDVFFKLGYAPNINIKPHGIEATCVADSDMVPAVTRAPSMVKATGFSMPAVKKDERASDTSLPLAA